MMVGPRPKNAAANKSRATHGMTGTKLYKLWITMRDRCENPGSSSYQHYGARGIYVCGQWSSFEVFFEDMGSPPPGHSLERIDNDGPYAPSNCRWASRTEQGRNKRNNHMLAAFGEEQCIAAWAQDPRCRVGLRTLVTRIWRGWDAESAISQPPAYRGQKKWLPVPSTEKEAA